MKIIIVIAIGYFLYRIFKALKKESDHYTEISLLKLDYDNSPSVIDNHENKYTSLYRSVPSSFHYQTPSIDSNLRSKIKRLKTVISNLENNFSRETNNFVDKGYKIQYQKELNPRQLEAAATINGKTLVIAGAGSGKTRTLTYRASFLLENGINAEKVLILTFTKKAAGEIKKRVSQLLGGDTSNHITSGTFHSFCNMLLARYSKLLGINPKFVILDQEDSRDLIDLLKKQTEMKKKEEIPFPRKSVIQNIISSSRNRLIPIEEIIKQHYPNFYCYTHEILELSQMYENYKNTNNLYDYDDLIDKINYHLKSNSRFKESIHRKYKYIMVDEYQDTNLPQKELIDLLAEKEDCSLMVVGDDNQSIYAFRGANYENILLFGATYPNAKLIKLEQNYRSTPSIIEFINNISNKISLGYKKDLFSKDKGRGRKPEFVRCTNEEQEAQFIADKIIEIKERLAYKEIAVLCRASFHSNFVQAEFLKRGIPFIVVGGIKFIEKRHVKDILAYLKILWNPLDAISWHRILTILDGIGNITANKITKEIQAEGGKLTPLKNKSYVKKNENLKLIYDALTSAENASSLIAAFDVIEKYYIPVLKKIEGDWKNRIEDFRVLKRLCAEYGDIENFLSNLALDPPNDSKAIFTSAKPDEDSLTISTIHSAKGLEWNTIFVISLIDGAIPHYRSFEDYQELEEERKLFYVACSRAKENLYLTAPAYFSTYAAFFDNPSRFISEVDKKKYRHREKFKT